MATKEDFTSFSLGSPDEVRDALALTDALRGFLDRLAATGPDHTRVAALIGTLEQWRGRLDPPANEASSLWRKGPRNRPPALLPRLRFEEDGHHLTGTVTFGRFHIGRGAAHGGAISMVFDEAMGALAASDGRTLARTAFLNVDYRALTPIDTELQLAAWFEQEEGRKRFLRATMHEGDTLCAEARGLWVELRRS